MLAPTDTAPLHWSITANNRQTVVIQIRAGGSGSRTCRLYWRSSGQSFDPSRSMTQDYQAFVTSSYPAVNVYYALTFDVGANSNWNGLGTVVQLRVDPIDPCSDITDPVYIDYVHIDEAPAPTITVNPTSLSPQCDHGQNASSQTFTLSNTGSGTMNFSLSDDASWLSVSPSSGSLGTGGSTTITLSYSTSSLLAGSFIGRISISAPGATVTPVNYNVYLTVKGPTITVNPTSLSPQCDQGQNASSQTFTLSNTGSGTMNYSLSDDASWLSVSPASGSVGAGGSTTISVSYSTSSLLAGSFIGKISISAPGATITPVNYNVYLTVDPYPFAENAYYQATGDSGVYLYQNNYVRLFSGFAGTPVDTSSQRFYGMVRFGKDIGQWAWGDGIIIKVDPAIINAFYTANQGCDIFKPHGTGNGSSWKALDPAHPVVDPNYPDIQASSVFELVLVPPNNTPKWKCFTSMEEFEQHRAQPPHNENADEARAKILKVQYANELYTMFGGAGWFGTVDKPQLLSPPNGLVPPITDKKVAFTWRTVEGATKYQLQVDNDQLFGSPELDVESLAINYPEFGELEDYFASGTYNWRVRAFVNGSWLNVWSDTWQFQYDTPTPGDPVFVPLHWLYKSSAGSYYATREDRVVNNENAGYTYEGIACYVSASAATGTIPLYSLYNPTSNTYYYTADEADRAQRLSQGFKGSADGVIGYIYPDPADDLLVLYRFYDAATKTCLLTASKDEYDQLQGAGLEAAVAGYVSANGLMYALAHRAPQGSLGAVDTGTGALRQAYNQHGVQFHGYGPAFDFSLNYNSLTARNLGGNIERVGNALVLPLGVGWSHSFNAYLMEDPDGNTVVRWGDGSESYFKKNGGNYEPQGGEYHTLSRTPTTYNLTKKDQSKFIFSKYSFGSGQLQQFVFFVSQIQDKNGNAVTFARSSSGRLDSATDAAGRMLTFAYGTTGRLAGVLDAQIGRSLSFSYNSSGMLAAFTNARGKTTTFAYTTDNQLNLITHPKGNTESFAYENSKIKTATLPNNETYAYQYNASSTPGLTEVTDQLGRKAQYLHDPNSFVVTQINDFNENAASITYDSVHKTLPAAIRDRRGNYTYFTYDTNGNVLSIKDAQNKVARFSYDGSSHLLSRSEFADEATTGPTTTYAWSGNNLTDITDPLTHTTHIAYNGKGQPTSIVDGRSYTTSVAYDSDGNAWRITDPEGNVTENGYDAAARLLSVKNALLQVTAYQYDANDNMTRVTDASLHPVNLSYDDNDNLQQISYSRSGVTDSIQYAYDVHDRLQTVIDPYGKSYVYAYADNGDLATETDPRGQAKQYSYDANHNVTRIDYLGGGQSVTFSYDENGNMIGMDESWLPSAHSFGYDTLDRLVSHIDPYGQTVGYAYDQAGRRTSVTYPGSRVVSYAFDNANRLTDVWDWVGGHYIYGYDTGDNVTSLINANSTATTYGYDRASRLTNIVHKKPDNAAFASYTFVLNAVGNPASVTTVDPIAPVLKALDVSSVIGADNRLLSQSDGISYSYDFSGNCTGKTTSGTGTTFAYDYENRLAQVGSGGNTIQYVYDGLGNRIVKNENGTVTRYVLDTAGSMAEVLMETDVNGVPKAFYVHGIELLAKVTSAGERFCYHGDQVGSVVAMTNSAGSMVNKYAYSPFGTILAKQESVTNPFKYVGQFGVTDEGNDLLFMRARFYDAANGRFLAKDPIGFDGGDWNLYAYAENSPLFGNDPSGNSAAGTAFKYIQLGASLNDKWFLGNPYLKLTLYTALKMTPLKPAVVAAEAFEVGGKWIAAYVMVQCGVNLKAETWSELTVDTAFFFADAFAPVSHAKPITELKIGAAKKARKLIIESFAKDNIKKVTQNSLTTFLKRYGPVR